MVFKNYTTKHFKARVLKIRKISSKGTNYKIKLILFVAPTDTVAVDLAKETKFVLTCPTLNDGDFVLWYKYDKKASKDVELGFSDKIFFPSLTEVEIRGVKPGFSAVYKCKVPFTEELLKTFEVKATGM